MKKILLAILMLAVISTAAIAEAPFSFRGGIGWGMPTADISAIEGRECDIEYAFDADHLIQFYENTSVSKYTADMQFVFWDDQLRLIAYDFHSAADADAFAYLGGAMETAYGPSMISDPAEIADVLNHVVPDLYLPEELTDCYCWQLPDTCIYMFRYPDASFAIVYTDSIYFESATGFNVSGL